jgi:hypothetical protein
MEIRWLLEIILADLVIKSQLNIVDICISLEINSVNLVIKNQYNWY